MKRISIVIILTFLLCFTLNASYQNLFEGYGSQASNGPGALFYNPAMLGHRYAPTLDINIIKLGIEGANNFLSIDFWNKYIVKDTFYQADKDTILMNMPGGGWMIHPRVNTNVLGLKIGGFAFAPRVVTGANLNLPKDLFDLGFNGNKLGSIYDFSNGNLGAIIYGEISAGYGQAIELNNEHNLYVGASFSYLYGLACFETTKNSSYFNSDSGYFEASDTIAYRFCENPKGNPGFGMNLGFAYDITETFTAGISLKNAYSFINWNADSMDFSDSTYEFDPAIGGIISGEVIFNLDSLNLYKIIDMYLSGDSINEDSIFNRFIDTSFSKSYDPFTTHLPPILNIGAVWRGIYDPWKLAFNYEQGFSNTALSSVIPKFYIEGEYAFANVIPVRAGIGVGGRELLEYEVGLGFEFPYAYLGLGASNHRGIFYGLKGLSAELNLGLRTPIWAVIDGIVKDSITGKPMIVDYTVTYQRGKTFTKSTDKEGKFKFHLDATDVKIQIKEKDYEAKTIEFAVGPKDRIHKNILMQPSTGLLICKVVDKLSGKAMQNVPVHIISAKPVKGITNSTGVTKFNLLEDKYKISIRIKDYVPYTASVNIKKAKSFTQVCELKLNKGYIVGKAQNAKTKEGVKCKITVLDSLLKEYKTIETDTNGIYRQLLPSGKYTMKVKPLVKGYIKQEVPFEIKSAETTKKDILLLKKKMKLTFRNINFDLNKAKIKPESYPVLDSLGTIMVQNPSIIVRIGGHTDTRGSRNYNLRLSRRRAYAVKMYIIKNFNISKKRMYSKGYGESRPLVYPEKTKSDYAKNRRVEFEVLRELK